MRPFIDFVRERTYLKNVFPRTVEFYGDCHKSVQRFGDFTKDGLKHGIIASQEAGISPASINTRITGINAYLYWCGAGYKLQFLKEPQCVLPILGASELTRPSDASHTESANVGYSFSPRTGTDASPSGVGMDRRKSSLASALT